MSAITSSQKTPSNKQVCDMDGEMKTDAISISSTAIENFVEEKQQAAHIKRFFDSKYGPTWHVIVGSDFKAHVVSCRYTCLVFIEKL